MQQFIQYLRKPHVFQDMKESFLVSAQFQPDDLEEQQKGQYLEEEFQTVFRQFFKELCKGDLWKGKSNESIVKEIREGQVEQSSIIVQFDSWLDQEDTKFKATAKPPPPLTTAPPPPPTPTPAHKQPPPTPILHSLNSQAPSTHSHNFANPVHSYNTLPAHNHNAPSTPAHNHPTTTKTSKNQIFKLEKVVPPSPGTRPAAQQSNPSPNAHHHNSHSTSVPPPPTPPPSQPHQHNPTYQKGNDPQYVVVQPQRGLRPQQKGKLRLFDKLMDYMDSPQRYAITKAQIAPYFSKSKTDHK